MGSRAVGLEITAESIKVAELYKGGAGITLNSLASSPIPGGLMINGEIINTDEMAKSIRTILNNAGITAREVVLTLSGPGVVMREMTLPSMPVNEMREVIKSELEKNKLFVTDGFIFDYHPLSDISKKGYKKTKVLFVGISCRVLSSYLESMEKAGLTVVSIDIPPLSLAASQYTDLMRDEATASVLIDETRSYLTVVRKGKFYLFYTIDIGMKHISPASGESVQGSSDKTLQSLESEMERLIKLYEIAFGEGRITKILLAYDCARYPGLDKQIATDLGDGIEVSITDPLNMVKLSRRLKGDSGYEARVAGFAVTIGAALKAFKKGYHNMSFPYLQRYIPRPAELKKRVFATVACYLVIGLIATCVVAYTNFLHSRLQVTIKDKSAQLSIIDSKLANVKEMAIRHRDLRERLQRQAAYLAQLNSTSWTTILYKVTERIPENVWLSRFHSNDAGKVELDGASFIVDDVAGFIKQMEKGKSLAPIDLKSIKHKRFTAEASGVDFSIEGNLAVERDNTDGKEKTQ